MAGRKLVRDSVFLTDPGSLAVTRFVKGDTIPDRFKVGDHLFTDEPDVAGTPQTGSFGVVALIGHDADVNPDGDAAGSGGSYDPGEGSVEEVLAYVGDDQARAREVLAAEQAGKNRKGIVEPLEKIANP